jgi:hypothetical protein
MTGGPPIARLDRARVDFLRDVVATGRPLVIGGKARGWRKLPRWTPAGLAARLGSRRVEVAASSTDAFDYGADERRYDLAEMPFGELVERVARPIPGEPRLYLMQQPLRRWFPELEPELTLPRGLAETSVLRHLWVGAAGNSTPLHYDTAHNLFAQIHGRKRFTVFEPSDAPRLFPHAEGSRHPHVSRIDPERPDLTTFPAFAEARASDVVLEPGELLFLPARYWHHVRSLDVSISVNTWWAPPGVRLGVDQSSQLAR